MALTLAIARSPQDTITHFLTLESELWRYFQAVEKHQGLDLSAITGLDPYRDTVISGEKLDQLEGQLRDLHHTLTTLFDQAPLPAPLEPPETIGLEEDPDGEPCGWPGTLAFIDKLLELCRESRKQGLPVLAIGD